MKSIIALAIAFLAVACAGSDPAPAIPPTHTLEPTLIVIAASTVGPTPEPQAIPLATPTSVPAPRPTPTEPPTPPPTPLPPLPTAVAAAAIPPPEEDPAYEDSAVAYAYCNGRYFGSDAQSRYTLTMSQLDAGTRSLSEVREDVSRLCNGNFTNPRERLQNPTSTPLPTPTYDPREENATGGQRRQYVLDLINSLRADSNLPRFQRSSLPTAHNHAEYSRNNCTTGLWRLSGESLLHTYHQDGGAHQVWMIDTGYDRCANQIPDDYPTWKEAAAEFVRLIRAQSNNPIDDPQYALASVGFAWTPAQRWITAIFETERTYISSSAGSPWQPLLQPRVTPVAVPDPDRTALIKDGRATLTATLAKATGPVNRNSLIVRVYHAPLAQRLTRYQINHANLSSPGNLVAVATPSLAQDDDTPGLTPTPPPTRPSSADDAPQSQHLVPDAPDCRASRRLELDESAFDYHNVICRGAWLSPYDLPPEHSGNPPSASHKRVTTTTNTPGIPVVIPAMRARYLEIITSPQGQQLQVSVNISSIQQLHGAGIYSIEVWGSINDKPTMLAWGAGAYRPEAQ